MQVILFNVLLASLAAALPAVENNNVVQDETRPGCGVRTAEFPLNVTREADFSAAGGGALAQAETFPWLATLATQDRVCAGGFVSASVIAVPANCVTDVPAREMRVREAGGATYEVESVLVHPDFKPGHPAHEHDIALVKLDSDQPEAKAHYRTACLPKVGDDPVDNCQIVAPLAEEKDVNLLAYNTRFEPSIACMETPQLRGYISSSENIMCSESNCLERVRGPAFCAINGHYHLVALPTTADTWCDVGAMTRVAKYSEWIKKSVEFLSNEDMLEREEHATREEELLSERVNDSADGPCARQPCGDNAVCWSSGSTYRCSCDDEHPHGNPYYSCHKCLYDQNCASFGPRSTCENKTCTAPTKLPVPEAYFQVGNTKYLISQEALPWPQAQYECLSRQGHLAEVVTINELAQLASVLSEANATGRYWVGASDFEEDGKFQWFQNGSMLNTDNFVAAPKENLDQRCIQVGSEGGAGKWVAHSCESVSQYICEYDENLAYAPVNKNGLEGENVERTDRQRKFDTLNPRAPYKNICGRRFIRQGRIVGGGVSSYGEWPWQVSLRQYKNGQFRHKCGATLLTHNWVITAAHCVKGISPSNLLVRIGEYNVLDTSETHKHVDRRITRVITHVNFDKNSYEYDIALLKLVERVDFKPNIIPICLPSNTKGDLVGKVGTVTGWGRRTEFGNISPVLREVNLPIISNTKCMSLYRRSGQNEWIPRIFVCAGTANGGEDSCEGDSGGPMVIKGRNGRYELAGVISWGIGCGDRNRPGVYTRISEFKNWIVRNSNY